MSKTPEIYAFVLQNGKRHELPGAWAALRAEHLLLERDIDAAELLEALQSRFPLVDLLESGVAVKVGDGQLALHPAFDDSRALLLGLSESANAQPFALLVGDACLGGSGWAICEVLKDYRVRDRLANEHECLQISFSQQDFGILWALNFPVAPATGLGCFRRDQIDEFCGAFEISRHAAGFGAPGSQPSLTLKPTLNLAAWSVEKLDLASPCGCAEVSEHFQSLRDHLELQLDPTTLWRPSTKALQRIRFCLEAGDAVDMQTALYESIQERCEELCPPEVVKVRLQKVPTYSQLWLEWMASDGRRKNPYARDALWRELMESYKQQVLQPLLRSAERAADPVTKNAYLLLANLSDVLHRKALLLLAEFADRTRPRGPMTSGLLPEDDFKEWKEALEQFLSMARLTQGRRSGKGRQTPLKKLKQPSLVWGLLAQKSTRSANKASSAPSGGERGR